MKAHIDCFDTPLADLRGAAARDPIVVFDTIMQQGGRFSTFDVNGPLAKSITFLFQNGYLKDDGKEGYPYIRCLVTELGQAWRNGRVSDCPSCGGAGHITKRFSKRSGICVHCSHCGGIGKIISATHPTEQRG